MFNSEKLAKLTADLEAAQARITTLESENGTLTEARDAAQGQLATAQASVASLTGERDTARTELTQAIEKIKGLETSHATEIKTLKDGMEATISAEVINRCAAAGVEPVARDPEAGAKAADTKTSPAAGLSGIAKARVLLSVRHKELYGGN